MNARVLVTGEYFCDLVFGDLSAAPAPGREVFGTGPLIVPGGTFNIAAGLARLGLPVAWACAFGSDTFSRLVRAQAVEAGISPQAFLDLPGPMPRISAGFSVGGDRGFISASDAPVRPVETGLAPEWAVQTFRTSPDWIAAARAFSSRGTRLFGTCRDCDARLEDPATRALLATLEVFAPSESEALRLTGAATATEALAQLGAHVPVVAITRGALGAIVGVGAGAGAGAEVIEVPGHKIAVTDTIGAGDAFVCGWLAATLAGLPLEGRARAGCLFGAAAVTRPGGGNPPDGAEILRLAECLGQAQDTRLAALLRAGTIATEPTFRSMTDQGVTT